MDFFSCWPLGIDVDVLSAGPADFAEALSQEVIGLLNCISQYTTYTGTYLQFIYAMFL